MLFTELKIDFSLMQPLCQISKKLCWQSIIWVRRSEPKPTKINIRHVAQSTLVKNSIINIHLPLMIFIRMHSQESQFHIKCLFCSIMSIIYVQIASFVRAFGKQIQTLVQVQSDEKFKKLYYRSKKLVKLSIESIFRMFLS